MKLFIVESPSKCSKLKSILGKDYKVLPSVGHIRSIPKKGLNIDVKNNFQPTFEISLDKKQVVKDLKKEAEKANEIILATDPDREGEAISWHIYEILNKACKKKCKRITFDSITKTAVMKALGNKRDLDMDQVYAQHARQILDRLVGYKISPLLWFSVCSGTSAGRVQSIALKIIAERELEIKKFKPSDFWYIDILFENKEDFWARVVTKDKDNRYVDDAIALKDLEDLKKSSFYVDKVERKEKRNKPYAPFDTPSMLQAATSILGWTVKKTTALAQKLYEQGKVSYIRTDSFNISEDAMKEVRSLIKTSQDSQYLPNNPNIYKKKSKASAQEAHECIRPTHCDDNGHSIINEDEKKLYSLIRDRFIASQMTPMVLDTVTYTIKASCGKTLIAKGQTIKFDGWFKRYKHISTKENTLPNLKEGEEMEPKDYNKSKHTTQAPPRYNEASLVKKMETEGVGRPSTYASIMESIQKRGYVEKEKSKKGSLGATDLGMDVYQFLNNHFKDFFMDISFTSTMEDSLSEIACGNKGHIDVLEETYSILQSEIKKTKLDEKISGVNESTGEKCKKCEKGFITKKRGKFGNFYACDQYPDCKTIYNKLEDDTFRIKEKVISKETKKTCPSCEKQGKTHKLLERKNKRDGNLFLGCSNYPSCKYTEAIEEKDLKDIGL